MKERRTFEKYNATQPLALRHVTLIPGPSVTLQVRTSNIAQNDK